MSRINTNVSSMLAQRVLQEQSQTLNKSLERLSTGLRINRGGDDPAGLIASEALRAEKTAIGAAIANAERADQVVNIAEGGLTEISALLQELQGLIGQSANDAGLSAEEKEANQLQIDSILNTIDRVANSTSFQNTKLLNGNFAYTVEGVDNSELSEVRVDAARIPTGGQIDVNVDVVAAAQTGRVFFDNDAVSAGSGSFTIEVAGVGGVQQFTFAEGTSTEDIVSAVNTFSDVTGVVAASAAGDDVQFDSREFGSNQFVSVTLIAGHDNYDDKVFAADAAGAKEAGTGANTHRGDGVDATVNINGQTAQVNGLVARVASSSLDVTVTIADGINTAGEDSQFSITGGGATFQLSPKVDLSGQASLGIEAVTTGRLGSADNRLSTLAAGGANNVVNGNLTNAQEAVETAISQIGKLRGRLGSFQANEVGATIRSLGVALENTSAAESQIRDTDFAAETAALTRSQILVQAGTNILSIANATPQNVLALLA